LCAVPLHERKWIKKQSERQKEIMCEKTNNFAKNSHTMAHTCCLIIYDVDDEFTFYCFKYYWKQLLQPNDSNNFAMIFNRKSSLRLPTTMPAVIIIFSPKELKMWKGRKVVQKPMELTKNVFCGECVCECVHYCSIYHPIILP
jgi:hypothetical protein